MTEPDSPEPDTTEPESPAPGPKDKTRRRFQELLEAKKAGHDSASASGNAKRGSSQHLPGAKTGRTFRRRKV